VALFSPTRHEYNIQLAPDALAADLEPAWNRQGGTNDTLFAEDATEVPNLLVDVGGVRALAVERSVPAPQIEATLNAAGTQLRLRNSSDRAWDELLIGKVDGRAQRIPALGPGQEQTIDLVFDRFVQDGFTDDGGGIIDRRAVLSQLGNAIIPNVVNGGQFFPGGPAPAIEVMPAQGAASAPADLQLQPDTAGTLYVLGWQAETLTPVTLDGRPSSSGGETLYIWPVRKEL
jgi:hypothetical protein